VLVRDVLIAPPEPGDVLVAPATGAYGYAPANNYNGQPRPAVVMVGDGETRVIIDGRRRTTSSDCSARFGPERRVGQCNE
jgi:diaminopimelate decarboxylase